MAMSISAPMSGITPYVGGGVGVAYNKYFKTQGERDCVEVAA